MMITCLSHHKGSKITPELDRIDLPEENYQILDVLKILVTPVQKIASNCHHCRHCYEKWF